MINKDVMLKSNLLKNLLRHMLETPKARSTHIINDKVKFLEIYNGQSAGNQIYTRIYEDPQRLHAKLLYIYF